MEKIYNVVNMLKNHDSDEPVSIRLAGVTYQEAFDFIKNNNPRRGYRYDLINTKTGRFTSFVIK